MLRRAIRASITLSVVLTYALASPPPARAQAGPDTTAPFFDDGIVHDIYFTINSRDWETLRVNYLDNTYYPVDFKWNNISVRNAGIRSRGTGSRSGEKPGLRLDFDRYTANQNFLGMKSVILRNSVQDPSNMHEHLSMQIFKRLGLVAPREIYARLFINNAYAGLYVVVESIDKRFLAASFGDDTGYLYKYDYNVEDPPYYLTYRTSNPADYVPHPFKPETHETDPQGEVLERFAWTVNNAPDATFRQAITEFVDLIDFVKHVASEVFVADNDGFVGNWGMNNYYIYRLAASHQFRFVDWDKSNAFADTPDYPIWHNHLDTPEPTRNRLWTRVMALPDMKTLFLDTLAECARMASEIPADSLPTDTRGWLVREVDRQNLLITPAVLADTTKLYSNDQFQTAVSFVRRFAVERPNLVRSQVDQSR